MGVQLGLDPEVARLLTLQTAFGAAKMALESPENPAAARSGHVAGRHHRAGDQRLPG